MTAVDRQRYREALHGVQSAIAFNHSAGLAPRDEYKDLRVGADSAHISNGALVSLLVDKGLITLDEYEAKLAHYAERELMNWQQKYPGVNFR